MWQTSPKTIRGPFKGHFAGVGDLGTEKLARLPHWPRFSDSRYLPTTRKSSLLINSARCVSAAFTAAAVCFRVLAFDPKMTVPPITAAIDPIVTAGLKPRGDEGVGAPAPARETIARPGDAGDSCTGNLEPSN